MKFQKGHPKLENAGRKPGTPNKVLADVRRMVMEALDRAGGVDYLWQQAKKNPQAFLRLVSQCIPRDVRVTGELGLGQIVQQLLAAREAMIRQGKIEQQGGEVIKDASARVIEAGPAPALPAAPISPPADSGSNSVQGDNASSCQGDTKSAQDVEGGEA